MLKSSITLSQNQGNFCLLVRIMPIKTPSRTISLFSRKIIYMSVLLKDNPTNSIFIITEIGLMMLPKKMKTEIFHIHYVKLFK